jgi:hypothetical protein
MERSRHRASRRASVGFLFALLLVPLALAAHTHRDSLASDSCATCVAVHHTPTLAAPSPAVAASPVRLVALVPQRPSARVSAERLVPSGRGPPILTVS